MKSEKPVFDYNICMSCTACIYTCPTGCIVKKDAVINKQVDVVPILKEEDCIGCGQCVSACPVGAIILIDK